MDWESLPLIRTVLQRRPHVTRWSMQGAKSHSTAVSSWSSMPPSRLEAAGSELSKQNPLSTCYHNDETPSSPISPHSGSGMSPAFPECIQPSAPKASLDLSAWVDNTNRFTRKSQSGLPSTEREIGVEKIVPWMQMSQQGLFNGVRRTKYRETPLYSEPGSLALSRAYGSDELPWLKLRATNSSWGTFGMSNSHSGSDSSSCSKDSSTDFEASSASDDGNVCGEERVSVSSWRSSALSIQCRGDHTLATTPMQLVQLPTPRFEENEPPKPHTSAFTDWAEGGSSGRSSPYCSDYVYEVSNCFSSE